MSFKSKFLPLLETHMNRYTQGGFVTGDIVRLKKGYKNSELFKKMEKGMQAKLQAMDESGDVLRVSAVKNRYPAQQPGVDQYPPIDTQLDITSEIAPGRYYGFITVPAELVELVDNDGINLPKINDKLKRKSPEYEDGLPQQIKHDKETDTFRQTRMADNGGKLSPTDSQLKESVDKRLASQYFF